MFSPLVSILIPVYNRERYIAECIESAINQTYTNIEIIIVDNSSDDNTWEICQKFAAMDQRIRIFQNETNIGPVRNWIRCAQEAKGVFSKILFSDDLLRRNCIELMVPKLDDSDIAFVYCSAQIGESIDRAVIAYARRDSSKLRSTQFVKLVLSGKAPVSPGAVLLRTRDLLDNLHTSFQSATPRNFEVNGAGPDVMILFLTSQRYSYVVNISIPLVYFRIHAGSFSIENFNNDVDKGYRSAIAWYLMTYYGHKFWIDYLAYSWLQQLRSRGVWCSPAVYLTEYEGSGKTFEALELLLNALRHLKRKLLGQTAFTDFYS